MDCALHIKNDQSSFSLLFYTQGTKNIQTLYGDQTEINVPETKSKKSYRVSLLYIILQAD
jgi:hypothetical protein